jgi:hypothetical protein
MQTFFSMAMRTFIFKMHNNTLAINTIVSHFVRNVSRNCTFCDINMNPEEDDETILHLFYNCHVIEELRDNFYRKLTGDNNFMVSRHEFFCEFRRGSRFYNDTMRVTILLLLKFIWDCKTRKTLPGLIKASLYVYDELMTMKIVSAKFGEILARSGIFVDNLAQNLA